MRKEILIDSLEEVFEALNREYNADGRFDDGMAMAAGFGELSDQDTRSLDFHFVLNLCYGPWREGRQKDVWRKVYGGFKFSCNGDIRGISEQTNIEFPLDWQRKRVINLAKYLNHEGLTLSEFLTGMKDKTGLEIRDEFKKVLEARSVKTASTFIRDCLPQKRVFPIDVRLGKILGYLGFPNDEDMMVYACQIAKVNSNLFNRLLYHHVGKRCNRRQAEVCSQCPIHASCYFLQFGSAFDSLGGASGRRLKRKT